MDGLSGGEGGGGGGGGGLAGVGGGEGGGGGRSHCKSEHGMHTLSVEPRALNLNALPEPPFRANRAEEGVEERRVACHTLRSCVGAPKSTVSSAPALQNVMTTSAWYELAWKLFSTVSLAPRQAEGGGGGLGGMGGEGGRGGEKGAGGGGSS